MNTKKKLLIAVLLCLCLNVYSSDNLKGRGCRTSQVVVGTVLFNASERGISLNYLDYFFDRMEIKLNPGHSVQIPLVQPTWFFDPHVNRRAGYLIHPGDSIELSYEKSGYIWMTTLKSSYNKELNLSALLNKNASHGLNTILFGNREADLNEQFNSIEGISARKLKADKKYLDSIDLGRLNEDGLFNCMQKTTYLDHLSRLLIGVWNNKTFNDFANIKKEKFDSQYHSLLRAEYNESSCNPISYKNIIYSFFVRHVQFLLGESPFINGVYTQPDADSLYHYAKKELWNNKYLLEKILFLVVKNEVTAFPNSSKSCLNDFFKDCKDSAYLEYYRILWKNRINISVKEGDDILLAGNNNNYYFSEVVKANFGKVIYIDLWASWCSPCRSEFPFIKKLRQHYGDDKVAVIYISIDENNVLWRKASKQENIDEYRFSYLLPLFKSSTLRKKLKMASIPRYLLFDREGKLVNTAAAKPSSKTIINQLDHLLSKSVEPSADAL